MAMGSDVTYSWSTTGGPGLPDTIVCPENQDAIGSFDSGGYKSGTKSFLSDGYYVFSGWKYKIGSEEYGIGDGERVYEDLDVYGTWTWYTQTVDEVGDEALAASIIDRSITYIYDSTSTKIGEYAFNSCSNLTTVNFPNAVDLYYRSLSDCSSLTTVDFPNLATIGQNSIYNCDNLVELCFPNVTSISGSGIDECDNLTTIDFWKKISCFQGPFPNNKKLTAVILRSTDGVSSVLYDLGWANTFDSGLTYVYVPAALVDSYKEASVWKKYPDQIRALEDYTDDGTTTGKFVPPSS